MVWSSTKAGRAESHPLSARPFFIGRLKMVHAAVLLEVMMTGIQERLLAMQDRGYQSFMARLMPTVAPERIIGVRTPHIRTLARDFLRNEATLAKDFLAALPHHYYEENNLHVFLMNLITDFDSCRSQVELFLPHLDNWATCDSLRPTAFKKNRHLVLPLAKGWMASNHTYTVRFGISCMMCYFLRDGFDPEHLELVGNVDSEDYYVRMMQAWYFSTALDIQYQPTLAYLEQDRLGQWTHNKTIQKAVESRRIPADRKAVLREIKR